MSERKNLPAENNLHRELLHAVFQAALLSYLLYYLIETFSPSFISRFYYLGDHLWVVIALGLLAALYPLQQQEREARPVSTPQKIFLGLGALAAALLLFVKIKALGWLAFVIVPLVVLVIFGISLNIIRHHDDQS